MKLPSNSLAGHLRRCTTLLPSIYLISGDEFLLVDELIQQIMAHANQLGYVRHNVTVDRQFDLSALEQLTSTGNLFAERIVIILRCQIAIHAALGKFLAGFSQQSSDTTIIVHSGKLSAAEQKKTWYQSIEKKGVTIPVWPVERQALPSWLQQRAKVMNFSLDSEALTFLVQYTEGNLLAADQILKQAQLGAGNGGVVTLDYLAQFLQDESRFDVFQLSDSFLLGDLARYLHILNRLQGEGAEPVVICWALAREIRLLYQLHQERRHSTMQALCKKYRIWQKRQPIVQRALGRLTLHCCEQLLCHLARLDRVSKGVEIGNAWQLLQQLAVEDYSALA